MSDLTNQKKSFFFGLTVGVAVLAIVGFFVMFGMYKDLKGGGSPQAAGNPTANNQPTSPPPSGGKVEVAVSEGDHIRGNPDAPITIVEFSDLQCPFCTRFHETMKQVVANYPDDVRWVYKHFPLDSIHPIARPAAEASECAAEQGKFWEYADEIFANQAQLSQNYLTTAAQNIGLNMGDFENCVDSGKYKTAVNDDYQYGVELGVRGTPGNFVNGQSVPGAVPYEQIQSIIESLK